MDLVVKVVVVAELMFLFCIGSSHAFLENIGRKQNLVNPNPNPNPNNHNHNRDKIRPDLHDLASQQANKQLNIQLHVGDEESGFFTVRDMIVRLGGGMSAGGTGDDNDNGDGGGGYSSSSGGHHLDVLSKGTYVTMKGLQHIDCDDEGSSWEVCWSEGSPAGTLLFAFCLPETYHRNGAVLPEGTLWLSFPVWTEEGLLYGQQAKRKVLEEIEYYDRKWNAELDKYELTDNPVLRIIHEWWAHFYATKCDELYDYTLDTIPDGGDSNGGNGGGSNGGVYCHRMQEDFLLSNRGLIWKREGDYDVLIGHATVSPFSKNSKVSSSLRP